MICIPSGKLALLSFQNFRVFVMLFCSVIYTVSCVPEAKVYHVIPCFSIRWKSKGSFFIKHLTLILSWSLIVTTLGKLISFSLKVTVTSFQSISNVYHMQFLFSFTFSAFSVPVILKKIYATCCFA